LNSVAAENNRLSLSFIVTLAAVTIHVCGSDGQRIGEFGEAEFRDKIFASALHPESYYWHEGMTDWKPISEYRALAKTQRISFAPPPRPTVRINVDVGDTAQAKADTSKGRSVIARFWQRITKKR
jgi:hypothetical protein